MLKPRDVGDAYRSLHPYFSGAISCIGISINVLFIVVLSQRRLRSAINVLLTMIAVTDTLLLALLLIYNVQYNLVYAGTCTPKRHTRNWAIFYLINANISYILHGFSTFFTCELAIIRTYIVSCKQIVNIKIATVLKLALVAVTFVIFGSVALFLSQGISNVHVSANSSYLGINCTVYFLNGGEPFISYVVDVSDYSESKNFLPTRLTFWITAVYFKLIPTICLTVCITFLTNHLVVSRRNHSQLVSSKSRFNSPTPAIREQECLLDPELKAVDPRPVILHCITEPNNPTPIALHCFSASSCSRPAVLQCKSEPISRCKLHLIRNYKQKDGAMQTLSEESSGYRQRPEARVGSSKGSSIALISILSIFALTQIPQAICCLYCAVGGAACFENVYVPLGDIFELLSMINQCVNFIMYCAMSREFRKVLFRLARSRKSIRR